jgi:hypothetical protein
VPSQIDPSTPVDGVPAVKADLRANLQAARTEIEALQDGLDSEISALQSGKADIGHIHTLADSEVTASRDFALADAQDELLRVDSPNLVTMTIPPSSSVAFPLGTVLTLTRWGTGPVAIAAGPGVSLIKPADRANLARAQYGVLGLWQRALDEWLLYGDLS